MQTARYGKVLKGNLQTSIIPSNASAPAYLAATVTGTFSDLGVKGAFNIYQNCPAIVCDYYLREYNGAIAIRIKAGWRIKKHRK